MKKPTTFKIGEREYTLVFTIRALANMERSIGRSILSIIAGTQAEWMRSMTVDFTAYGLKYGLQGMPDKFDPYKVIEDAFENGMELNELTGYILLAIEQTGLFQIRTPEPMTAKTGETETETEKK